MQELGHDANVTDSFKIWMQDGNLPQKSETLTINISGTNDKPTIGVAAGTSDSAAADVIEGNIDPSDVDEAEATGTLTFSDIDLGDTVKVTKLALNDADFITVSYTHLYRPKLDVYAGVGRYNLDGDGYRYTLNNMYNHDYDGFSAVATQPVYDGNLTNSSVKRYKYAKNMRYFDLLSTMEQVSYTAFRSHQDVVRYRELTALAKENLARHEEVLEKVRKRTQAGVDSSVNYDTAYGRVALAKVNLITEESNLHDAETQYMRIVGVAPSAELEDHMIEIALPALPQESRKAALAGNYQLISYAENAESMRHVVGEQASRMRPKVDVRAGTYLNHDEDGTEGRKDKAFIELVLHWNLYNGGLDKENIKKAVEQYKESEELYNKLERDVVQSVLIAYNDIKNIEAQMPNLEAHMKAADVTRAAYTKQFEAGRRSLFDLLDSENEYFQAKMSYANAQI